MRAKMHPMFASQNIQCKQLWVVLNTRKLHGLLSFINPNLYIKKRTRAAAEITHQVQKNIKKDRIGPNDQETKKVYLKITGTTPRHKILLKLNILTGWFSSKLFIGSLYLQSIWKTIWDIENDLKLMDHVSTRLDIQFRCKTLSSSNYFLVSRYLEAILMEHSLLLSRYNDLISQGIKLIDTPLDEGKGH